MGISNQATKIGVMNAARMTGQVYSDTILHLFSNQIVIGPTTLLADLVECTFDGYTEVDPVAFNAAFATQTGQVVLAAPSEDFVMTGTTTLETVYGWYLTDLDGTDLVYAESLANAVSLTSVGQGLLIQPTVTYGT